MFLILWRDGVSLVAEGCTGKEKYQFLEGYLLVTTANKSSTGLNIENSSFNSDVNSGFWMLCRH